MQKKNITGNIDTDKHFFLFALFYSFYFVIHCSMGPLFFEGKEPCRSRRFCIPNLVFDFIGQDGPKPL